MATSSFDYMVLDDLEHVRKGYPWKVILKDWRWTMGSASVDECSDPLRMAIDDAVKELRG